MKKIMDPDWIKSLRAAESNPSDKAWADVDEHSIRLAHEGLKPRDGLEMCIRRLGGTPGENPPDGPVKERAIECLLQASLRGLRD